MNSDQEAKQHSMFRRFRTTPFTPIFCMFWFLLPQSRPRFCNINLVLQETRQEQLGSVIWKFVAAFPKHHLFFHQMFLSTQLHARVPPALHAGIPSSASSGSRILCLSLRLRLCPMSELDPGFIARTSKGFSAKRLSFESMSKLDSNT